MRPAQETCDTGCKPHPEKGQDAGDICLQKKLGTAQGRLNQGWRWAEVTWRRESAQEHVWGGSPLKTKEGHERQPGMGVNF